MPNNDGGGGWIALIVIGWIFYSLVGEAWHSKMRYFVEYGALNDIDYKQVSIDPIPHDCDWLKAPLGYKECHYEASVEVIRTGLDSKTARPIFSYDGGKTWQWNDSKSGSDVVKPGVYVAWNKADE